MSNSVRLITTRICSKYNQIIMYIVRFFPLFLTFYFSDFLYFLSPGRAIVVLIDQCRWHPLIMPNQHWNFSLNSTPLLSYSDFPYDNRVKAEPSILKDTKTTSWKHLKKNGHTKENSEEVDNLGYCFTSSSSQNPTSRISKTYNM